MGRAASRRSLVSAREKAPVTAAVATRGLFLGLPRVHRTPANQKWVLGHDLAYLRTVELDGEHPIAQREPKQ